MFSTHPGGLTDFEVRREESLKADSLYNGLSALETLRCSAPWVSPHAGIERAVGAETPGRGFASGQVRVAEGIVKSAQVTAVLIDMP